MKSIRTISKKQNKEDEQVYILPGPRQAVRCFVVHGLPALVPQLTVVRVLQDVDLGGVVVHPQAAADGHRQRDVEGLLPLVQGVVDDHHAAQFLPLAAVKAQDAAVILRPRDVVRVGQDGGRNRTRSRTCGRRRTGSTFGKQNCE